ncbi:hypothetical protein LOTGIDRAFT_141651 [Lottia gigantea]|uniref:Myosin light chain kinase, smooth muscle n=1 Tax=Lottia gigantea TaxID=225164 RepID=V4AXJ2_LOTGI|nr:hypothetical protein LOTGIDRAFT_141651 [Lottia gigantea]ESO99750.1 hypothetical protein LOTGIDRAFT_141651 [Lottia gigantea]
MNLPDCKLPPSGAQHDFRHLLSKKSEISTEPKLLQTLTNQTVKYGGQAVLFCEVRGKPEPDIKWSVNQRDIQGRVHIKTLTNSSVLTIDDLQQADSGKYTIIAENDLGYDKAKIFISVEDVPYSPMGCPSVSEITSNAVSLAWYGPAYDGGSPITAYTVECCKGNSRKWTSLTNNCRNTFYQAQSLEPNTQYCFRIRAGNKHGMSEASEPSELITTYEDCSSTMDYESDDELPFEPKYVDIDKSRKFEDYFDTMEEIGRGKFGNVFKCKDKKTKKIWAAKILKCREKEKDNIRNEINVMNKLHHPKVLMLWDAFEAAKSMVLVMEYIQGGELFERVISDDFELTEGDVIHFMRQICDGLGYIHQQNVLHLDLKPENILCISSKTNQIKIIDFGLAQNFKRGESVKVLFGTPEFIAPEVVNYDEISFATDLWSVGVICYVLLSGLSPFLGDSENETLSNVTLGEYDFDDDAFTEISDNAKDFIQKLLIKKKQKRHTIDQCKNHQWLAQDEKRIRCKRLNTEKLKHFMARRKWQKTGMAIRALGRMASLKNLFCNSSMGSGSSSISNLDLNSGDSVDCGVKPCFVKEMMDCEVFCGDVIRFDVVISNFTDVQWYYEDDLITQDKRHIIDFNEDGRCSLIIRQVTTEDDGEYTCTAVNKHGETSCYADLIVCGTGAI